MEILLSVLLFISIVCGVFLMVFFIACIICSVSYYKQLYWHKCKYCKHKMTYQGLKGEDYDAHHLFHCEHCGAWELITLSDFIKNV